MITDHAFRRPGDPSRCRLDECEYMNCRRPRAEHDRANERGDLVAEAIEARRS